MILFSLIVCTLVCGFELGAMAEFEKALVPGGEASGSAARSGGRDRIRAQLLLDTAGRRAGVLFDLDPGWHLYWRNPGQIGLATELTFTAVGTRFSPIGWPAPRRFSSADMGLVSYGYEGRVLLSSQFDDLSGSESIRAQADLLVCRSECIPAHFELVREVPAQANYSSAEREREVFDRYARKHPVAPFERDVSLDAIYSRSLLRPGDHFEVAISMRNCASGRSSCVLHEIDPGHPDGGFFPGPGLADGIELSRQAMTTSRPHDSGSTRMLTLWGSLDPELDVPIRRFSGVLGVVDDQGHRRTIQVDLPFPFASAGSEQSEMHEALRETPAAPLAPPSPFRNSSLIQMLLLALIGGILINAMPCVLPVLGIKICSIAELAHRDRGELRRHGLTYTGGILLSMALLAATVIALRSAGTQVGWGFQFQEPAFIAVVSSVVVLFALNLFGVFELQFSSNRLSQIGGESTGVTRSFFDGLLAVVLATPCTAPFLGTAVGFAFAHGPVTILMIFLTIGIGLAAPYGLVCLVPGWARFVPKPGNWMLRLRAGLGFLLLGTAVWLLWIYGQSCGVDGLVQLLALWVSLGFGGWALGQAQALHRPRTALGIGTAVLVLAIAGVNGIQVDGTSAARGETERAGWKRYDEDGVARALAEGRPAFVSFTADWCITCKVNERAVLASDEVQRALVDQGFTTFRADWTRRDDAIRQELARHGRAGVPLYLVYDPRRPGAPVVLPEILDTSTVVDALYRASGGSSPAVTSMATASLR